MRRFKLKINGESPRSLFLAYVLSKLKCDVYVYDLLRNSDLEKDYRILLFSNSSKNLLSKFNIWEEIEDISYGITSLSINDNLVSEQLLIRTDNLPKKNFNTIGWTSKYSDIKSLLIKKLDNSDNVHFISMNKLIDKSLIFDYEFNFKSYDQIINIFKFTLTNFKRKDEQILVFDVYLRGHNEKRLYEIITTKGLLVLTPLNKNLYQVVWNNPSSLIKETSISSKSLFLDYLTTLLPAELKIDQIIGDINLLDVNNIYSNYLIKNNVIYINENKFKSNIIYDLNFDVIIKTILCIYNYFQNIKPRNFKILNKLGFYFLLKNYIEIIINFSVVNFLFNLFEVNNVFSLFFRKLLFTINRRINLIKILVMIKLTFINKNNSL